MNVRALTLLLASLLVIALVAGCGGSPSNGMTSMTTPTAPTAPATPTTNSGAALRVYVVQSIGNAPSTILQFAATASGSVSPIATIAPGTIAAQVNTDQYGNIYYFTDHIVELASGATGAASPIREVQAGAISRLCCMDGMTVSPAGAVVVGQDNGEVDEWSASATGSVAPTRYILGASETGGGASLVVVANQVAVDAADTLYVTPQGAPGTPLVEQFSATAAGNAAPIRTVGPTSAANGVTVDSTGTVYVTTTTCTGVLAATTCAGTISVYAASSISTATPVRVIAGSATTMRVMAGIKVDALGNIYVVSTGLGESSPAVLKFAAGATGNVAPMSSFTSTAWTGTDFNASIAIY